MIKINNNFIVARWKSKTQDSLSWGLILFAKRFDPFFLMVKNPSWWQYNTIVKG